MKIPKIMIVAAMLTTFQFSNVFAQNVTKLYEEKKFKEVLSAIDAALIENKTNLAYLSKLYFIRGSSQFNLVYQARIGGVFGADNVFDEKRPRFELAFQNSYINLINGAISDLQKAISSGRESTTVVRNFDGNGQNFTYDLNFETEILNMQALVHLEKAQFITNSYEDFSSAYTVFNELNSIHDANISRFGGKFGDDNTRVKNGEMLAAEIRIKVALGDLYGANQLYGKWQIANGYAALKKQLGIPSMVEAFDMVGSYKYAESFLLREAIRQITMDKGKVVPGNFTLLKAVMKSHLSNMNFAVAILPDGKLLSLQRARLSSAYNIKGNLTPAESTFIKNAPDAIKADKNTPPLDVQLNSVMLKLQSTDKKESNAANKMLEEMSNKDETNAAILAVRGYAKMLNQDFVGSETDLSAAIKKDVFLAFAYGAFQNRALVYTKLGKADAATKDEQENSRFKQLLAFMAAG